MAPASTFAAALRLAREDMDSAMQWRLAAVVLVVMAAAVLAAVGPLALKAMVDAVASAQGRAGPLHVSAVIVPGAAYLLALGGARFLAELRPLLAGQMEQRLHRRLCLRCYKKLLQLPMAFHVASRPGATVQVIQQAATGFQLLSASLVNGVAPVLVEVTTIALVLVHAGQPALVLSFLVTTLAYLCAFVPGALRLRKHAAAVSHTAQGTHAVLAEGLMNCETLKSFNAEPLACARLEASTAQLETAWSTLHRHRAHMGFSAAAVFIASVATSLAIAAHGVASGALSVGGFVLANVYMLQILRPLETLGAAARDAAQAIEWIRPALALLDQPSEPGPALCHAHAAAPPARPDVSAQATSHRSTNHHTAPDHAPSVHFRNVHFAYHGANPVLTGLDLDIPAGHTLAVVGASGCGKSSLVRLLLRLYEPDQGAIQLDGKPLTTLSPADLRSSVGLVPQDVVLFNDSIAANIALGHPGASRAAIEYAARLAHLHGFIQTLPAGYDTVVGERGSRLSGGERQRVAIARAVLRCPRFFLLDEATSMLDGATEAAILHTLREVTAGCTTLVIAHRLSTVTHADAIVVLHQGRVAQRGTHAELLARPGPYARLWRLQASAGSRT